MTDAIIDRRDLPGVVVEFGCFKGGSTAKLSLACAYAGKQLRVFDSFEGLPEPKAWDAEHQIERKRIFRRGEYAGSLEEVTANVRRHGDLSVCDFRQGWFAETLHGFAEPVSVAFVDVDLVESTDQVISAIWPLVVRGGVLYVHDATDEKLQSLLQPERFPGASESFVPARGDIPTLRTKTLAWFAC